MDVDAYLRAVFSDIPKDQLSSAMPTWSGDSLADRRVILNTATALGG